MDAVTRRRAAIARRYAKKPADKPPVSIAALRITELVRLFTARYGRTLPDDDAGRDDAFVMAHHLARRHGDARRVRNWLDLNAPWMPEGEAAELVRAAIAGPLKWRADKLAQRLRLTEAERRRLRICTIGAIDMTKAERKIARKLRARKRARSRRRERGARPRAEYLAGKSISRSKPWLALGISRRTWYRQRGTSPCAL